MRMGGPPNFVECQTKIAFEGDFCEHGEDPKIPKNRGF